MFEYHLNNIKDKLKQLGLQVVDFDLNRPWGAFFCINELQAQLFSDYFFDEIDINDLKIMNKLSPKILIIKPNVKLSWQYHNRRAEIWQVYEGEIGVIKSDNDIQPKMEIFRPGDQIKIEMGMRHRIVGLEGYGIVAEIWQHTEVIPSDESDIVRVQDDFGRN